MDWRFTTEDARIKLKYTSSTRQFNSWRMLLNQSQGGMCICGVAEIGKGISRGVTRPLIAAPSCSAVSPHPSGWPALPEAAMPTLSCTASDAPQAQVASGLLSRPAPDGLVSVEVRAVAPGRFTSRRLSPGVAEVFPHRLPTVKLAHCPRSRSTARRASPATASEEGQLDRRFRLLLWPSSSIHSTSARLQARRRVIAGLLPVAEGAGRVPHQGRRPFQHAICPAVRRQPGSGPRRQRGTLAPVFPRLSHKVPRTPQQSPLVSSRPP